MPNSEILKMRQPIIKLCIGCNKIDNNFCRMFIHPARKWKLNKCPLASHVKDVHE